jgi:hypothetical protein
MALLVTPGKGLTTSLQFDPRKSDDTGKSINPENFRKMPVETYMQE